METWIIENETAIRLSFFFGIFLLVALWEVLTPRRPLNYSKPVRWYSNIGLVFINSIVMRYLFPNIASGLAILASQRGWGLFNNYNIPYTFVIIISLLLQDGAIYIQHAMFHYLPLLWRFHRMHHTDTDLDVTSGARFHPVEIIISMCIKLSVIAVLGPPVEAVIIFEVLLNLTAMFNHGNIYIPPKIDQMLRCFVVTPDMHRVHHSISSKETNSNFGFNFPWWDAMFGTYCAQPEKDHKEMIIGLNQFRDPKELHLHKLLIQPFLESTGDYHINK